MPIKPLEIMLGKIAPYGAIGRAQAVVIVLAGLFVFEAPLLGSPVALVLLSLIFFVCNL